MNIEARLKKLEERQGRITDIVVVYPGDPEPQNLLPGTTVLRVQYDED